MYKTEREAVVTNEIGLLWIPYRYSLSSSFRFAIKMEGNK